VWPGRLAEAAKTTDGTTPMSTHLLQPERSTADAPLSVAQLTALVKGLLETAFPRLWVAGELSNVVRPQSGHVYFTLKDDTAQLRSVMWRGQAARAPMKLQDGLEVVCRGHVDVYAPRGSYQLVVEEIQPRGLGQLELALRQLRDRLAKEGLFDRDRKRPLPRFPKTIAVVTSPTGAAIRDFLQVVRRRWHGVHVLIVPTRVQGHGASDEIAAAIRTVGRLRLPVDVVVVTRGGGSLEDLWAFNEEPVVRAIAASPIPTVSAVGHEIDVTLADLVADVRALTPSEAAERVVLKAADVLADLGSREERLRIAMRGRLELSRARVDAIAHRPVFLRPLDPIRDLSRRLDELDIRARRSIRQCYETAQQRLGGVAGLLESLSPLRVLQRGYTVTLSRRTGTPIRDTSELVVGGQITTRFYRGWATSRVEQVEPTTEPDTQRTTEPHRADRSRRESE